MTVREQLNSIAEERIIVLDGAMGSVIQILNLDEKSYRGSRFTDHPVSLEGCYDLLCLTRPGAIGAIYETYLEAGADIIETCSFNSTSISLSDYGLGHLSYEICKTAAQIARGSADKFSNKDRPRFVAGSIGPTAKGASIYPDVNKPEIRNICWDELEAAYYDNARGLLDGGVDIFLVETIFDTLNAKAALFAISKLLEERNIDVPVIISASISNESGRLLSGQSLETFIISVLHANPWAIGLNCSFNANKLLPHVRFVSEITPCYTCAYPNAGNPNKYGRYEEMPDIMAANIETYLREGYVNIIGGCCGTTPAHIVAIAEKVKNFAPRKTKSDILFNTFSGLEPYYAVDNSIYINDPSNTNDREKFQKFITDGEYEDAADVARLMIDKGETVLNIEIDDEKALNAFLDYALMNPYVARVPFLISSLKMNVIEAGLKRLQGHGLAGPFSLINGDEELIQKIKLVHQYGASALITLVDEQGSFPEPDLLPEAIVAEINQRKNEIENRIKKLLEDNGLSVDTIVFDRDSCPNVNFAI